MWRVKNILGIIVALCTIIILLITSVDLNAFHHSFYQNEYRSMKTYDYIGMSEKDLMRTTDTLLDYIQKDREDMKIVVDVNGVKREVFNKREKAHMVDVLNLYQNVLMVRRIAIGLLVVSLGLLIGIWRKDILGSLAYRFMQVSLGFVVFIGGLSIWAMIDFYSFWTSFHELFFSNDLWLLNPATDIMIQMFPQDFFFHMVIRIVLSFVSVFGLLFGLSLWYVKRWIKNIQKEEKEHDGNETINTSK